MPVFDDTEDEKTRQKTERAELGRRLRAVRIQQGRSLRDVGDAAGVSESFISQVERGLTSPSVITLRRIANALNVHIIELFAAEDGAGQLVRAKDRGRYQDPKLHWSDEFLTPRSARRLQVNLSRLQAGQGIAEAYTHESDEECIIVLEGKLDVTSNGASYELDEGDALLINPRLPHSFMNPGPDETRVLWVMTPPSW